MATAKPKRLYQVWKGSNRFFCGGRLIFGPEVSSLFISMLLIAGPSMAFCSQVVAKIHNHKKDINNEGNSGQSSILGFPVLLVTILIAVADLSFLLLTSSRDPGIVPRNTRAESDEQFNVTTPSMEWVYGRTPHLRIPHTKDVIINGFIVKVKYCDTCFRYRPPRASHCSVCNNCVQKFDHHCPWVGQCIGLRNYRFFVLFISSSTFLCIYIFTFSWLNIFGERRNYNNSILKSMRSEIISVLLILYTFFSVWFVGGLTIFHLYLISTNQTTYENFRYRYDKRDNPYNMGALRNFKDIFFSKIPPSMNDFRSWVPDETVEIGPVTPTTRVNIISPREQIGIEMGSKPELEGDMPIPSILQNVDYCAIDDNLEEEDRHEDDVPDHFNSLEEYFDQEPRDSYLSCTEAEGMLVDEIAAEGFGSNRSPSHVEQDVSVL